MKVCIAYVGRGGRGGRGGICWKGWCDVQGGGHFSSVSPLAPLPLPPTAPDFSLAAERQHSCLERVSDQIL